MKHKLILAVVATAQIFPAAVLAVPTGPVFELMCQCSCSDGTNGPQLAIDVKPVGGSCDALEGAQCDRSETSTGSVADCKKKVERTSPLDFLNEGRPDANNQNTTNAPVAND